MAGAGWWTSAFGADYLAVYAHRDEAAAAAEVAGLVPRLRAAVDASGLPVLDAGCGAGRHLAALRGSGLPAIGFDLSADLLAVARARMAAPLLRADLRRPPLAAGGCAAVVALFTVFGYFDEAGNAACLAALAQVAAPGGWLVLDLPDAERVAAGLVPESHRVLADGTSIAERRWLSGARVEKEVVMRGPGGERRWRESVRLYRRSELADLAGGSGVRIDAIWPSLQGPAIDQGRTVLWLQR